MKIINLNSISNGDVLVLKEDTEIKVEGVVELKQIVCDGACKHLVITGDTLHVYNPDHGIAIGNDAHWGLSYGRFEYSNLVTDIYIDCKEIKAHSLTPGCGIGCYGRRAAQDSWFGSTCTVRDTPINMVIHNEPLSGSTKRSVLPVYMTKEEKLQKDNESNEAFDSKMLQQLAVHVFKHEASIRFEDIYNERITDRLIEKFYFYVCDVFYKVEAINFANCLQRAFASLVSCIKEMPGIDANLYMPLYDIVAYAALCRELELFDKVAKYPLSMRYRQVIDDLTFNGMPEFKDIKNMSSFEEIHLTDELITYYNHPTDMDYTKECNRSWYGMPIYFWNDWYNELIDDKDEVLKTFASKMLSTSIPYGIRCMKPLYALVIKDDGLDCEVMEITDNELVFSDGRTFGLVSAEFICKDVYKRLKAYSPNKD